MRAPYKKDKRSREFFQKFHNRSRKRNPRAQGLLLLLLTPLILALASVRVHGLKNIPKGGYIVAANHPSTLDPFFLSLVLRRRVHFMGKSDIFDGGLKGKLFSRLGAFPVRRGVWDVDAFETAETVIKRGKVMGIFPEGGCSAKDGSYRDARPGIGYVAQRTGATVLPVHITGTRGMYKPWSMPKIEVVIGEPFQIAADAQPSRESNQAVAEAALEQIKGLTI